MFMRITTCLLLLGVVLSPAAPASDDEASEPVYSAPSVSNPCLCRGRPGQRATPAGAKSQTLGRAARRVLVIDLGPLPDKERTLRLHGRKAPIPLLPRRIGVHRPLPSEFTGNLAPHLDWTADPDGRHTAAITFNAEGAVSLRLAVAATLPPGASVQVFDGDGQPRGPAFTPADFDASGAPVWLPSAEGDTLTAQIALPSAEAVEALWFTVPSVAHRFASVGPRTSPVDPQAGEGEEEECTEPVDLLCAGKSLAYDTADAIGRITVEEAVGYTSQCTGTMLNTASAVQSRRVRIGTSAAARGVLPATLIYFLTANHCVSTHTEAASVEVLSFYRRTTCNGEYDRRHRAFLRGAELLASSSVRDSTLLRFKKRQDDLDELPFRVVPSRVDH